MLKTGQKTFQQICAENGRDWKKVVDEIEEACSYASEKGFDLMAMITGGPREKEEEENNGKKANEK